MPEVQKSHQFLLIYEQMNSLASGVIWDILLIQKLENFVIKLVCVTSTCQSF